MLSPGEKIGPYIIREQAGQGGMATVYQAWHEGLHRLEALKVPRNASQNLSDSAYIQRLLAEARVAAGLHHPNIVAIHGVSEPLAPIPFFAMDWVQGRDLAQILRQKGAFTLAETIEILEKVASALDYAHGRGVVHRDIKPANILLSEESGVLVPKVVDFGISRAAEDEDGAGETKLTRSGMIVGTPEYMSPEQAGSGERVDYRTDIYSLGIVAYEMLCGAPPFTAGSGVSRLTILISQVRDGAPLWEKFPDFPREVGTAVLHALAKIPAERPSSCADFIAELQRAALQQGENSWSPPILNQNEERTPFDGAPFERDESATIFERPISLSDTPPPGPPPTLSPQGKGAQTALETPAESPTVNTYSLRARLEAVAQTPLPEVKPKANPAPEIAPAAAPIPQKSAPKPIVARPVSAPVIPPVKAIPARPPRGTSRNPLVAAVGGLLVATALIFALSRRNPTSPIVSKASEMRSNPAVKSAVASHSETPDSPPGAPPIAAKPPVSLPRLRIAKVRRTAAIPFETVTQRSSRRPRGTRFVAQSGQNGKRETTLQISYQGTREMARRALSERIILQPKPEIVVIGTRESAPPTRNRFDSPSQSSPRIRTARPKTRKLATRTPIRRVRTAREAPRAFVKSNVVSRPRPIRAVRQVREAPLPP